MAKAYEFIEYKNVYDNDITMWALKKDGVQQVIDGVKFIEVTTDFQRAQLVRADSLKPVKVIVKYY